MPKLAQDSFLNLVLPYIGIRSSPWEEKSFELAILHVGLWSHACTIGCWPSAISLLYHVIPSPQTTITIVLPGDGAVVMVVGCCVVVDSVVVVGVVVTASESEWRRKNNKMDNVICAIHTNNCVERNMYKPPMPLTSVRTESLHQAESAEKYQRKLESQSWL